MMAPMAECPRIMSKLAILRHGTSNPHTCLLTLDGEIQMKRIGGKIANIRDAGQSTLIIASTAPRALASAKVLGEVDVLNAPVEGHEVLWSDREHPMRLGEAYTLIQTAGKRADLVVAVTHLEYAQDLPEYVGERDGISVLPWESDIRKGCGFLLDYMSKATTPLKW